MHRQTILATTSVLGLIGLMALAPAPAFAQDAADSDQAAVSSEIIVTAQRREERQVDVPIAITTLGSQQLATGNVQNLADIQKLTPSLRFDNQTGFFQPTVRGIGTAITTSGGGSNVGIYVDGFYSPNPVAADLQLTKLKSIQVLKGPQGTLFGHNTTGGAILVTTAEPSEDPEVDVKASYGRFNAQKYQGYATVGLLPGVAADIEGVYSKGDGFVTDIISGNDKVGRYKNWTVRTGIKAEIAPGISVLARYQHSDQNDPTGQMINSNTDTTIDPTTGQPWGVQTSTSFPGLPDPIYTTDPDQVAITPGTKRVIHTKTDVAQLTIKADLGFADLASYTQYRHENTNQSEDLDQTAAPVFQLGLPIFDRTWSQELLLTSKPGSRLQWTAGFFFFSSKDTWQTFIDNSAPRLRFGGSGTTTQSYAGFVDGTYQLTDKLFLTAGVRYSHDIVKNAYFNTSFLAPSITLLDGTVVQTPNGIAPVPGIHSNHATPRAVIRFKPDDHSSIYASYTKGYKAAILDVGGSCQDGPAFQCNPIKPETINAFEIGYKYSDSRLSFETSAFYYDYKNLQVSEFLGEAQAYIVNAAKSEIYGVDAELRYKLGDYIELNAAAAWNHARYKSFGGQTVIDPITGQPTISGAPIYASCPGGIVGSGCFATVISNAGIVLHDVHMQHVPDFTATFGPRFTTGMTDHGEFSFSGSLYYSSKVYFSPSGTQFKQPAYATLDLRAQWDDPSKRYMAALYVTNVTDKRYRTQVQYNGFGVGASWSAPASWGAEVGVRF
jgi:iron complex outermembrane receptor protein